MTTVQVRYSILTPDPALSALKFRGWLQQESVNIQATARGEHDLIIIRLFMPQRLIAGITQRKLDVILQRVVDSHPNIHRIELRPVVGSLSFEQMMELASEAREDMRELVDSLEVECGDDESPTVH